MCAMHDITSALTLVMTDVKWNRMPVNLTNPVDVANGQNPVYRNRPEFDMPQAHANNAASAVVNLHRMAVQKHNDFSYASSALTTALLASIGEANEDTLRTTFPDLAPYMLTPRQIVDTMLAKHGVATGDDVRSNEAVTVFLTCKSPVFVCVVLYYFLLVHKEWTMLK